MAEMITTGVWRVSPSKQEAFETAWTDFATWASSMDGAGPLRLGRDSDDAQRYVSFGAWDSADQVRAWKSRPEFRERLAQVVQYTDEFNGSELDVVARAADGAGAASATLATR